MSQSDESTESVARPNTSPEFSSKLLAAIATALDLASQQAETQAQLRLALRLAEQHAAATQHLSAQIRSLLTRGRDLRTTTESVREAIDRTRVIALNAGLEGARLPEPHGRALLVVGEETRNAAAQGEAALEELMSHLAQIDGDRHALADNAARATEQVHSLHERLERTLEHTDQATGKLEDLVENLSRATGTEPEVARLAAAACDQVQGLLDTLNRLNSHRGAADALVSFRRELTPLVEILSRVCPPDARDQK
jgi:methyl-accepting chemotaxis protein